MNKADPNYMETPMMNTIQVTGPSKLPPLSALGSYNDKDNTFDDVARPLQTLPARKNRSRQH
jgi:hypothetical protein